MADQNSPRRQAAYHFFSRMLTILESEDDDADLKLDDFLANELWDGCIPLSDVRHPWHDHYVRSREEELRQAPQATDFQAERTAAKRRKL